MQGEARAAPTARQAVWRLLALAALCVSQGASGAITGTWTTTGSTLASTTLQGLMITHSGSTGGSTSYTNSALQASNSWWTNPYQGTVSGANALSNVYVPGNGFLTITVNFSSPVNNPVLHAARLGGGSTNNTINSSVWALSGWTAPGNIVMERLSGNAVLLQEVEGSARFRRETGASSANFNAQCADNAQSAACGSIRFNGSGITSLIFTVAMRGGAGSGDGIDFAWSLPDARITLDKALGNARAGSGDQFTVAIRTGGVNGPVVSSTTASTTAGSGAAVTPGSGTTGTFVATGDTLYTLTETGTAGTDLSRYDIKLSCTDAAGVMPAGSLPTNERFDPATGRAIRPPLGADLRCTLTNTANAAQITGRVFLDTGTGGGSANDGVPNGAEAPLAGVVVRLTDCTSTVHASSTTNGAGSYSLAVPASIAPGTSLCVEQVDGTARVSTGASVGATALPSGTATAVDGSSYTYTRGARPDRIAFAWNGASHGALNFGDVPQNTFAADGTREGVAGSTVSYGHTFRAGTAGRVRFSIAEESATPAINGWSAQIFADPGCSGSLQPGAAQLYPPLGASAPVAAGAQSCIIVRQFIPANAPLGASSRVVVQADFSYANANPALSASFTLQDVTLVGREGLALKKEVRNLTQNGSFSINNQARPGETLEYRITFTNQADASISNVTVNDTTPAYSSFISAASGTTPATLTGCTKRTPANRAPEPAVPCDAVQTAGGSGALEWRFEGAVEPGASGSVSYRVKVD